MPAIRCLPPQLASRLVEQINPGQFFFREDISVWREIFWMIQAAGRKINLARPRISFIGQRGSANVTEGSPGARIRAVSLRGSLFKSKFRKPHCNPGHRLGANRAPAIHTVAVSLINGFPGRSIPYLTTVTTPRDRSVSHAQRTSPINL